MKPEERADEQHDRVPERGHDEPDDEQQDREAEDRGGPDAEELGRLELEVRGAEVAEQVRAEVALLDDLVELGQRRGLERGRRTPLLAGSPAAFFVLPAA